MSKKQNVSISSTILKDKLIELFNKAEEPNAEILGEVIIENLARTEVGIDHLIHAFFGKRPNTNYSVGDQLSVSINGLPKWRWDVQKMIDSGMIKDGYVKTVVTDIDLNKKRCIQVSYNSITDTQPTASEDFWIEESDIKSVQLAPPRDIGELL